MLEFNKAAVSRRGRLHQYKIKLLARFHLIERERQKTSGREPEKQKEKNELKTLAIINKHYP